MVLVNLYRGLTGGRTFDPGARVHSKNLFKQLGQYVVADTDSRRMPKRGRFVRPRRGRKRRRLRIKRRVQARRNLQKIRVNDGDIAVLATAGGAYNQNITNIQVGDAINQRSEYSNTIRLYKYTFKGLIDWDNGGASATEGVRFILCYVEHGTATANVFGGATPLEYQGNIYGRLEHPTITHVLKDFRVQRRSTTQAYTPVRIRQHLKNKRILYNPRTASNGSISRDLVLYVVPGTKSDGNTKIIDHQSKIRWTE